MRAKEKFQQGQNRQAHEQWVGTKAAEEARDAAMLEFIEELPDAVDPSRGWDSHSRLCGARRFAEIFFSLHLKDEPKKSIRLPNLQSPS